MSVGLGVTRLENESWRDCVIRYAKTQQLEQECVELYDALVKHDPEEDAAFTALYEWDCLDLVEDEEPK